MAFTIMKAGSRHPYIGFVWMFLLKAYFLFRLKNVAIERPSRDWLVVNCDWLAAWFPGIWLADSEPLVGYCKQEADQEVAHALLIVVRKVT